MPPTPAPCSRVQSALLLLLSSITFVVHADEWDWLFDSSALPSSISLSLGKAEPDLRSRVLSLDLDTVLHHRLQLQYADAQSSEQTINNRQYSADWISNPLDRWCWHLQLGHSGQQDEMVTRELQLGGRFQNNTWQLQADWLQRKIFLYTDTQLQREIDIDSPGLRLGVQYFGISSWMLQISHQQFRYSKDTQKLSNPLAPLYFSDSALSLASGLEDRQTTLGIHYNIRAFSIGMQHHRSVSAVDKSLAISNELLASWGNLDWALAVQAGNTRYDSDTQRYIYSSIMLTKYF